MVLAQRLCGDFLFFFVRTIVPSLSFTRLPSRGLYDFTIMLLAVMFAYVTLYLLSGTCIRSALDGAGRYRADLTIGRAPLFNY